MANLIEVGADPMRLRADLIVGHPNGDEQSPEDLIYFDYNLGVRAVLLEFLPIPALPDGKFRRHWLDLNGSFWHNSSTFVVQELGFGELNPLKTWLPVESALRAGQNRGGHRTGN